MPAGRFTTWGGQLGAFTPAARATGGTAAGSTGSATGGGGKISINPIATPYDKILAQARANLQTPGQGANIANQQVSAQIDAALGASNASSKLEQQQFADLQNRAMGFASGLGDLLTREAPSVGQAYQNAANALGSYGTGLTGAVAADQQAVADKARAQVAGLIGEQNAGLVGGYDIPGLRSTAQYTGVTLPASDLGAQAATAVRLQNAAATQGYGEVAQTARDYAQQAIDALNQRAAERAKIIAQRPELYQTALQAQRDDRNQTLNRIADLTGNRATYLQNLATQRENIRQFNVGQRETRREFGITQADKRRQAKIDARQQAIENARADKQLGITQDYLGIAQQKFKQSTTGRDANGNVLPGYVEDPATGSVVSYSQWYSANAPGAYSDSLSRQRGVLVDSKGKAITDENGNPIPYVPKKSASGSKSGLSPSGLGSAFRDARGVANKAWKGRQKAIADAAKSTTTSGGTSGGGLNITGVNLGGGTSTTGAAPGVGSLLEDYTQTYNAVLESLRGSGMKNEKAIRAQARRAMRAAGWKTPTKLDVAASKWDLGVFGS